MRNIVMSGLARATVVVEAGDTSGAKMQAEHAIKHGKPVFLMASMLDRFEWARKFADKPGVFVLKSTDEV